MKTNYVHGWSKLGFFIKALYNYVVITMQNHIQLSTTKLSYCGLYLDALIFVFLFCFLIIRFLSLNSSVILVFFIFSYSYICLLVSPKILASFLSCFLSFLCNIGLKRFCNILHYFLVFRLFLI